MRWYGQPGTPQVAAEAAFDAQEGRYTLSFSQRNPLASDIEPYLIPIRVVLFDAVGQEIAGTARTLLLTESAQRFHFDGIATEPVPSLLRDFSAPVILDFAYAPEQLSHLLAFETDHFNAGRGSA